MVQSERDTRIIDNLGDEGSETIPIRYAITSYGADFPVDGLVKRMIEGDIFVPAFQRGYVWTLREASRFVESLLLGLPVPGIFLSREKETQKFLVIDGQQRLRTLQYYCEGFFPRTGKQFTLVDVNKDFRGLTYKLLPEEDRRKLDNSIIHATIVKQDKPSEDDSSIYHIFERLNTSGTPLYPQEIRACIYHGAFSTLLKELNETESWRAIYGKPSPRMRDQELILRFLALRFNGESYQRPMKEFLNSFMGRHRHLQSTTRDLYTKSFADTVTAIHTSLGESAFKPERALNAAVFDAIMVGIAKRLADRGAIQEVNLLQDRYNDLVRSQRFVLVTRKGTADEKSVKDRLSLATEAFSQLP